MGWKRTATLAVAYVGADVVYRYALACVGPSAEVMLIVVVVLLGLVFHAIMQASARLYRDGARVKAYAIAAAWVVVLFLSDTLVDRVVGAVTVGCQVS